MKTSHRYGYIALFLVIICLFSGCATIGQGVGGLFGLVGTIIGGTFKLVGTALKIVGSLPRPPPGVIPGVF